MIWEVKTSDGDMRFFTDKFEAEFATAEAVKRGLSALTTSIGMPRDARQLASLLQMVCDQARENRQTFGMPRSMYCPHSGEALEG